MPDLRKNKHMTLDDRIEIQECLNKDVSFKAIARRIGFKQQLTAAQALHTGTMQKALTDNQPVEVAQEDGQAKKTIWQRLFKN